MRDIYRLLAEQRIREYDLRLRHLDEVLAYAEMKLSLDPKKDETSTQLKKLKEERNQFAGWVEETKLKHLENWQEDEIIKAGPMGIWDAIAQQVEKLVERIER
jgi:hypothetical protein